MNESRRHITAAEDKVPFMRKIGYGTGMMGFALLIQIYLQFYNPIYNETLGLSPIWIGWVLFASRIWDGITDPVMGSVSDNTRSRWGRRRPWIFLGAVLCSLSFLALWWFPRGEWTTADARPVQNQTAEVATVPFQSLETSKLRLVFPDGEASVHEVMVRDFSGEIPVKVKAGSSVEGFEAKCIIDGDASTYWKMDSAQADGGQKEPEKAWLDLKLFKTRTLQEFQVRTASDFELMVWRGPSERFYIGWLLVASLLFYLSFTVFTVPYIALGMELSPDYHERTSVMTIRTVVEQIGFFVIASLYFLTSLERFADRAEGMRFNSLWVAVVIFIVIAIPALFAREHASAAKALEHQDIRKTKKKISLWLSIKETLSCWPFLNLGLITVVSYLGVITVGVLGYYVTIYHLFGGDTGEASGKLMTIVGWLIPISTMVALPLMNRLSKKIGKRNALITAFSLTIAGSLLRWPLYTPEAPYLSIIPTVLFGIGCAGAYMFINAMIPEAVDADELKTGERREGMFSAVYGWVYKLGFALAILLSGYVLEWTGYDAELGANQTPEAIFRLRFSFTWMAAISLVVTVLLVLTYPITEKKAYEIRERLEARRREDADA
jgi:GPH family glycoside/pentoside/hexuronide:cation symporter